MNSIIIDYPNTASLAEKTSLLLKAQKSEWKLLRDNYSAIRKILIRKFQFEGYSISTQFNPARITSTTAEVDSKSISQRKCFLCEANLFPDQKAILFKGKYFILCNPFPIFEEHFTIAATNHILQSIEENINDFLELSSGLGNKYTVIYNGPECGASAPDHLHFQAGSKSSLPILLEIQKLKSKYGQQIIKSNTEIYSINDGMRNFLVLASESANELAEMFSSILYQLKKEENKEPMVNLISFYENKKWTIILFPRSRHRPSFYYREGEDRLLISPASIDMGGLLIFPREKDYNRVTEDIINQIYKEVSITTSDLDKVTKKLSALK